MEAGPFLCVCQDNSLVFVCGFSVFPLPVQSREQGKCTNVQKKKNKNKKNFVATYFFVCLHGIYFQMNIP